MLLRQNKLNALEDWCAENSIFLDDKIYLGNHGQSGIGVFSKSDHIQPQNTLSRISKTSVLSVRSCSLAGVISNAPYGLAAQLSLSLALYVEMLKGIKSRWYGYLESFPVGIVDLPIFWSLPPEANTAVTATQNALTGSICLTGTEAAKIRDKELETGGTALEEVTRFYYESAEPTLLRHATVWRDGMNQTVPRLLDFYRAFSMVSSRAFLVDAYHGLAMVPIADTFNHVLENHVHLESDYSVCAECGSLYECAHDRDDRALQKIEPPAHFVADADKHDLFYEMVSNTEIPPHTEIFNTYGEDLSNAQLLTQYGFILDVNDSDRLSWDIDDVLAITALTPGFSTHSRDSVTLDMEHIVASLSADHSIFGDSQLIYREASDGNAFSLNADGAVSYQLWALVFRICSLEVGLESHNGDTSKLLSAVLTLQIELENMNNEGDSTDDEDEHMDAGEPIHFEQYSLNVLHAMCHLVVRLCTTRKANSGPEGFTEKQLFDILDKEVPEDDLEGRRIRLAISLLIGEHSILDACAAAWTALAEVVARLPRVDI